MTSTLSSILLATALLLGAVGIARFALILYRWARAALATLTAGFGLAALALGLDAETLAVVATGVIFFAFLAALVLVPLDIEQHRRALAAAAVRHGAPEFDTAPLAATRALRAGIISLAFLVVCGLGAAKAEQMGAPVTVQVLLISATVLTLIVGVVKVVALAIADVFEHDKLDDDLAIWASLLEPQAAWDWSHEHERITRRFRRFRPTRLDEGDLDDTKSSPRGSRA